MTSLFTLLKAADRIVCHGYDIDNIEFEGDVARLVPGSDDGVFFFKDQDVDMCDGCVSAMPCFDPEDDEDYGNFFDYDRNELLSIEFIMSRPMTLEDL